MKTYPAIIWEDGGLYYIKTPDVSGCLTYGETIEQAIEEMKDALCGCICVYEDEGVAVPEPSNVMELKTEPGQVLAMVEADVQRYRKMTDTQAVRKTISMPAWLAYLADKKIKNLSRFVQDALEKELQIG